MQRSYFRLTFYSFHNFLKHASVLTEILNIRTLGKIQKEIALDYYSIYFDLVGGNQTPLKWKTMVFLIYLTCPTGLPPEHSLQLSSASNLPFSIAMAGLCVSIESSYTLENPRTPYCFLFQHLLLVLD